MESLSLRGVIAMLTIAYYSVAVAAVVAVADAAVVSPLLHALSRLQTSPVNYAEAFPSKKVSCFLPFSLLEISLPHAQSTQPAVQRIPEALTY